MPSVKFVSEKKTIEVPAGANLRQEALRAGIELYPGIHRHFLGNCHGFGQCASCCVKVKKGKENLSPQTFYERLRMILGMFTSAARKGHEDELRLACRHTRAGRCRNRNQAGHHEPARRTVLGLTALLRLMAID